MADLYTFNFVLFCVQLRPSSWRALKRSKVEKIKDKKTRREGFLFCFLFFSTCTVCCWRLLPCGRFWGQCVEAAHTPACGDVCARHIFTQPGTFYVWNWLWTEQYSCTPWLLLSKLPWNTLEYGLWKCLILFSVAVWVSPALFYYYFCPFYQFSSLNYEQFLTKHVCIYYLCAWLSDGLEQLCLLCCFAF